MIKYLLKHKILIISIFILSIIVPIISAYLTFVLQDLYDVVGINENKNDILMLFVFIFVLWIVNRLLSFVKSIANSYMMKKINEELKTDLFNGTINMPLAKYSKVTDGEYIAQFTNDILILESKYFRNIIGIVSSTISIIVYVFSFIKLNYIIATSILIVAVFALLVPFIFSKYTNKYNLAYVNKVGDFTQKLKAYFSSFLLIKNYGIEEQCRKRFYKENEIVENKKFESEFFSIFADTLGSFFAWFMRFSCMGACIILLISGEITIGTIIAAISFTSDLASPLQEFVAQYNGIRSVKAIVKKNEERADNDISKVEKNKEIPLLCEKICYEDVSIEFNNKSIIKNFNFTFEQGKKYLIIGRNGSGKSTICKILKKYYEDYQGNIYIDGTNIKDISYNQLSANISYMNENVSIIYETIKDNITLDRNYTNEELNSAINTAKIEFDINRKIGDNGSKVSSGEKRKIEIARTMLKNIPVLIMDEVISTLDIETAFEMEKLCLDISDKMIIFISHNYSMRLIEKYDCIILLDDGKILDYGTHEQLLKKNKKYQDLVYTKTGIKYN